MGKKSTDFIIYVNFDGRGLTSSLSLVIVFQFIDTTLLQTFILPIKVLACSLTLITLLAVSLWL